jgi:uncharacterized protein DUF5985
MGPVVYILSTLTAATCAVLLLRGYASSGRLLLLWSGLCFVGLAASSLLVFADLVLFPEVDLYIYRLVTAAIALSLLLYGLISEASRR